MTPDFSIGRLWAAMGLFVLLIVLLIAACDSGGELIVQLHNGTERMVRVVVPRMATGADPPERPGADVTIAPGEVADARIVLPLGSYAEVVRAYAGDTLVFCERYAFPMDSYGRGVYSVNIVDGHVALACEDAAAAR